MSRSACHDYAIAVVWFTVVYDQYVTLRFRFKLPVHVNARAYQGAHAWPR